MKVSIDSSSKFLINLLASGGSAPGPLQMQILNLSRYLVTFLRKIRIHVYNLLNKAKFSLNLSKTRKDFA